MTKLLQTLCQQNSHVDLMKVVWDYNEAGLRPIEEIGVQKRSVVGVSREMERPSVEEQLQDDVPQSSQPEAQELGDIEGVTSSAEHTVVFAPPALSAPVPDRSSSTLPETSGPDLTSASESSASETPGIPILSWNLADDPHVQLTEAQKAEVQRMADYHGMVIEVWYLAALFVSVGVIAVVANWG